MEMMLPLAILSFVLSAKVIATNLSSSDEISYDDIRKLNVSCHPKDTCVRRGIDHSPGLDYWPGLVPENSCSCHAECSSLGTCCIDSPHRGKSSTNFKCVNVDFPPNFSFENSRGYYMIESCPENTVWKLLCEKSLDSYGDILMIAPVTSLYTNTTYKNYYCFRCYELTDNFLFWDLKLFGDYNQPMMDYDHPMMYYGEPMMDFDEPMTGDFKVTYNETDNTWTATAFEGYISITVNLVFVIPLAIKFPVIGCNPNVVADCPDSWKDDVIRRKCDAYMALLYDTSDLIYKNAHCALCNYVSLKRLYCEVLKVVSTYRPFSFVHLIYINLYGKETSKTPKCADSEMWNPYKKECRKLYCALPGYVIKDGKCVPP